MAVAISFPRTRVCKTKVCSTPRRVCRAKQSRCSIRIPSRKMAPSPSVGSTYRKNWIVYNDLNGRRSKFVEILGKQDASDAFVGLEEDALCFKTDLNAPKGRIVAVGAVRPHIMTAVVPEAADQLESGELVRD